MTLSRNIPSRFAHAGFTLVELLVVIGVIAVLIGLLLPALSVAQESARRTKCLSNLRQLAIAATWYNTNHRGYYPPAFYSTSDGSAAYGHSWDFTTVLDFSTGKKTVMPGLLWAGQTNVQIQQCPSFDGRSNTVLDPYTGYNYNTSYIGHGEGESPGGAFAPPARANQVRKPSETALFGDAQWATGANKYMRAPMPVPGYILVAAHAGTQGFRHRKLTNVAFCDGHATSLRDRFIAGNPNVAPGTGFLSDDNRLYDLK